MESQEIIKTNTTIQKEYLVTAVYHIDRPVLINVLMSTIIVTSLN